jgi:hypothetical protein
VRYEKLHALLEGADCKCDGPAGNGNIVRK